LALDSHAGIPASAGPTLLLFGVEHGAVVSSHRRDRARRWRRVRRGRVSPEPLLHPSHVISAPTAMPARIPDTTGAWRHASAGKGFLRFGSNQVAIVLWRRASRLAPLV